MHVSRFRTFTKNNATKIICDRLIMKKISSNMNLNNITDISSNMNLNNTTLFNHEICLNTLLYASKSFMLFLRYSNIELNSNFYIGIRYIVMSVDRKLSVLIPQKVASKSEHEGFR